MLLPKNLYIVSSAAFQLLKEEKKNEMEILRARIFVVVVIGICARVGIIFR